MFEIKLNLNTY